MAELIGKTPDYSGKSYATMVDLFTNGFDLSKPDVEAIMLIMTFWVEDNYDNRDDGDKYVIL